MQMVSHLGIYFKRGWIDLLDSQTSFTNQDYICYENSQFLICFHFIFLLLLNNRTLLVLDFKVFYKVDFTFLYKGYRLFNLGNLIFYIFLCMGFLSFVLLRLKSLNVFIEHDTKIRQY